MNYWVQIELLLGLMVMSFFLIAAGLWALAMQFKNRNDWLKTKKPKEHPSDQFRKQVLKSWEKDMGKEF
jgi:hypothetical protein